MKTAAKITALLVGIFLAIGFVVTELRGVMPDEGVKAISLPLLALAFLGGYFGIKRILRTAKANH